MLFWLLLISKKNIFLSYIWHCHNVYCYLGFPSDYLPYNYNFKLFNILLFPAIVTLWGNL